MSGVPMEEVTAHDFMQVRAALVARLGGANEALVWTRIHYRCAEVAYAHVDDEGMAWWPASSAAIATEVGLSVDQVDRALKGLRSAGFVESTEHRLGGNYDRTKSWRPVVLDPRGVESAIPRNGVRDSADRTPRNRGQDTAIPRNVPSSQTSEEVHAQNDLKVPVSFDEFWEVYPRRVGKEAARKAFAKAARSADPAVVLAAARTYAKDPNLPEKQFVPYPATWLNRGSWEDEPLPQRDGRPSPPDDDPELAWLADRS